MYGAHDGAHLEGPGIIYFFIVIGEAFYGAHCTAHIEPIAKLSQKLVLKSLHRFRTTAGVIMGLIHLCSLLSSLDVSRLRSDGPVSHLASTDY